MTFTLHPIDLGLIGLYLVFVIWLGLRLAKKHHNAEDYFLAGRSMIWRSTVIFCISLSFIEPAVAPGGRPQVSCIVWPTPAATPWRWCALKIG